MWIETAFWLYFLKQLFKKRPNEALFSAKSVHNDAVIKIPLEFDQNFRSKKTVLASKMWIETAYRLSFLKQRFEKRSNEALFSSKSVHNGALMKIRPEIDKKFSGGKKQFWLQKMWIETAYRLYFLKQLIELWPNEALFSAKSVHNDALMNIRLEIDQKFSGRKKQIWPQKCESRQTVLFEASFRKQAKWSTFFGQKCSQWCSDEDLTANRQKNF